MATSEASLSAEPLSAVPMSAVPMSEHLVPASTSTSTKRIRLDAGRGSSQHLPNEERDTWEPRAQHAR